MTPVIFAKQFAEIVRRLRQQKAQPDDPQLLLKFDNAYQMVLGGAIDQRASLTDVEYPNLEEQGQAEIIKANVEAVAGLYYAAQLEELKFFQVADKIVEQFELGQVPISRGQGGQYIYDYWQKAPERFTENDRRGFYARAFGFAQGSVDEPLPNREFADLWIRFLSAVSILEREKDITTRRALTGTTMLKNGRDLAVNISLHGYGVVHFAAIQLRSTIGQLLDMMKDPEVLAAYGVTDIWQLVERVSATFLGGSVNGVRQRTLASAGYSIIKWLAKNRDALQNSSIADPDDLVVDLVNDVERWLAVTGTGDAALEKYFEPVSVSQQPTIPGMQIQGVPDLLKGVMPRMTNGVPALSSLGPLPNLTPAKGVS